MIFAVLDVSFWTISLNSDKTSKVFELIFAVFLPGFIILLYHNGRESSKFHQNSACFWFLHPHETRTFSVRLYDEYQGHGFAIEALALVMPEIKLRARFLLPDGNNCCTQTDRQRSKVWPPQFRRNGLTHPVSRRPNFIKIAWRHTKPAVLLIHGWH